jgi:hypothetical protein
MKLWWSAVASLLFWSGCQSDTKATPTHQLKALNILAHEKEEAKKTSFVPSPTSAIPQGSWQTTSMPPLEKSQFLPVIDGGGHYYAVLQQSPNEALATGEARLTLLGDSLILQRDIEKAALPKEFSSWSDQSVRLFSAGGPLCEAKVESFALVGQVSGELFSEEVLALKDHPETISTLTKSAWKATQEGQGAQYLTAKLSFSSGCAGARFARLSSLPLPTQALASPTTGLLAKDAIRTFRALPEYKVVQRSYGAQVGIFTKTSPTKAWDTLDGTKPKVSVFQVGSSAPLVWVSAATAYYGCDGALYSLDAAFSLQSNVKENLLVPISTGTPSGELISPLAAIDVDLDGNPELLTEEGLWRLQGGKFQEWVTLSTPSFGESYCGE